MFDNLHLELRLSTSERRFVCFVNLQEQHVRRGESSSVDLTELGTRSKITPPQVSAYAKAEGRRLSG